MSAWNLVLLVVLAASVLVLHRTILAPWAKGTMGETRVSRRLRRALDPTEYIVLDDLTLRSGDGTTQIDHVIVSRFGVFVVETKNFKGWIYGSAEQAFWTQTLFKEKHKIFNPLKQNFKHVKVVQEILGLRSNHMRSVVAFVGTAEPKTSFPDNVVWSDGELVRFILSRRDIVLNEGAPAHLADRLENNNLGSGWRTRRDHIRHVKARVEAKQRDLSKCPRCGADLVERRQRSSGETFLGCSRFPLCKGSRRRR